MTESGVHIFGIRHHGPGSAASLRRALEHLEPDAILVEGPPDAQEVLELANHEAMKPPVALLIYQPDDPKKAAFYPFAEYSPEWQAIQYGLRQKVPVRFMDLPQAVMLAEDAEQAAVPAAAPDGENIRRDPIGHLARAAGYADGERWWEQMVEQRRDGDGEIFTAIQEAMTALREGWNGDGPDDLRERRREAYMRQTLRKTQKEGFAKIAVVCGAWHGPALATLPSIKSDADLLKGLPSVKTKAAWAPWSYSRISFWSGYGAGVHSPEWYHLLWEGRENLVTLWMTRAARLMRDQQLDVSSAHVIESVRLAQALAAMRGRALPGLEEMDESALAVMCFGEEAPMMLVRKKLIIGDRLGQIPDEAPVVPIQQDLTMLQKRLRLPVSEDSKDYDLDLRKPNDLERSRLLHRLALLEIHWGRPLDRQVQATGTFHEHWQVQWRPEFIVDLIGAARWGNTVRQAAAAKCIHTAEHCEPIREIAALLDSALLADLPEAAEALIGALQEKTATSGDVEQMMEAIAPLSRVMRYGSVRNTDRDMLAGVIDGLAARIMINLPGACVSINDEAAEKLFNLIGGTHSAITLLGNEEHTGGWARVLDQLSQLTNGHHLIGGRAVRLLHEMRRLKPDEAARRMSLALSAAGDSSQAAAWLEGFLRGGGLILIHDRVLWKVLDDWVCELKGDHFTGVLPLLRRTFSTFQSPERRQIGLQVKSLAVGGITEALRKGSDFDYERARRVLPVLSRILGEEIEL